MSARVAPRHEVLEWAVHEVVPDDWQIVRFRWEGDGEPAWGVYPVEGKTPPPDAAHDLASALAERGFRAEVREHNGTTFGSWPWIHVSLRLPPEDRPREDFHGRVVAWLERVPLARIQESGVLDPDDREALDLWDLARALRDEWTDIRLESRLHNSLALACEAQDARHRLEEQVARERRLALAARGLIDAMHGHACNKHGCPICRLARALAEQPASTFEVPAERLR